MYPYLFNPPDPTDLRHMQQALEVARAGEGHTAPNPAVGCVLAHGDMVVGQGFHPRAGAPHAEVFALEQAGAAARGATAYVTLEPCSHFGRTPPCADALIRAGVARVVMAALDPDPRVAGRGAARLQEAGIRVEVGLLEAQALRQQAGFRTRVTLGRPRVTFKYAMTLDGKVAALSGDSRWVSSPASRERVHRLRARLGAVAVGSGTVLADDPRLSARLPGEPERALRPVIFDRRGRTPAAAQALRSEAVVISAPEADLSHLEASAATLLRAGSLEEALGGLGALGFNDLLLEGGPTLAAAFLEAGLIDEVQVAIAPKLLGAGLSPLSGPLRARMSEALELPEPRWETVGPDLWVSADLSAVPAVKLSALLGQP
ncbi:diaminohydroxyphosphoribosylaminopyrimidine deaminase/5-amino-6-(5-phosphoribosylamino)uracil reductase [Deinobacterium chartae]|uniref:Riboflavin biosynthesis protein RibD n=1 Tax=Deinobacterium chartae TaxID=521158 RepID=A0A841I2F9_9DEIO|nr:bifunctional diaminohydroxyphosphoribosylaminopyrimidine deaminase/5-amino-6-(5-phosphoribosylamino)uracil reductase RibD [Deinobacterium chartae]MBB6098232.1 diaminohydroxyphosphoribosylaminopyrimidine deaminase/5-amino-6-(5-phosphoribosylamino)uracil reductase [Deinobacterium chartae]